MQINVLEQGNQSATAIVKDYLTNTVHVYFAETVEDLF